MAFLEPFKIEVGINHNFKMRNKQTVTMIMCCMMMCMMSHHSAIAKR